MGGLRIGSTAAQAPAWKYCPDCGLRLAGDWKFCVECGRPIYRGTQEGASR